ncbi:site-specific DNA-methyltransferase [bacterium]|nr:site-specific DNA-methyltransferase [bacterium]
MEKIDKYSMDIEQAEKDKLREIFPQCFVEGKLDIDKLLNLCGEYIDNDFEKYKFEWKGKADCYKIAGQRSTGTLRPCPDESVDFENTKNMYIEGDNLEVLKLLQNSYYGKIKMIYIDPPYNTGNDFVYEDDFKDPMAKYKEVTQQTTKSNPETMGRFHTNWLNMMYPRLRLASNLLREDGVIFISIDDNEEHNIRKLCDEVFGEENFVSKFIWINNERGRSIDKYISNTNDFILMYAKSIDALAINFKRESGEHLLQEYNMKDEISYYKKGDPLFNNNSKFNIETRPNLVYSIYINKNTNEKKCIDEKYKGANGLWILPQENKLGDDWIKVIPPLRNTNNLIGCWRWGITKFMAENEQELILEQQNSGKYMFFSKNRLTGDNEKLSKYKNIIQNITSSSATTEVVNLLGGKYFDHPKPVNLIKILVDIGASNNDIILDFFSGSATTAHAVMQLNAEDGGNRQFICVQLPELCDEKSEAFKAGYCNICEIGKERIRRAGKKIHGQASGQLSLEEKQPLDIGFKVLKLDTSNLAKWDSTPTEDENTLAQRLFTMNDTVKIDRNDLDVVYEVMLKLGIPLDYKVIPMEINDKKAYSIGEDCLVLVCLDFGKDGIMPEDIEAMCEYLPAKIVSSESAFKDDTALSNAYYILKDKDIEMQLL